MKEAAADVVAHYRARVIGTLPQFAGGSFQSLGAGPNSAVLECDGWIFKFARTEAARQKLRREAALLGFLRPRITTTLPQLVLHEGPEPFAQHRMIPGDPLGRAQYEALDDGRRNALATRLAQLYAELHALPLARVQGAGAVGAEPWMGPNEILVGAEPRLPRGYKGFLNRTIAAYRKLTIAGNELVFGFFDGHGGNLAFDHDTGMLNGVFDFGESGFGSRHRDLSYSNWIAADLTLRIIDRYEGLAGIAVNRECVMLYTSALRLAELAGGLLPRDTAVSSVEDWVTELKTIGMY